MRMILLLLVLFRYVLCYKEYAGFDPTNPTEAKCITQGGKLSYLYYGKHNKDINGNDCREWKTITDSHTSPDMFVDHNYCRSFSEHKELGPWCYGQDKPTRCFPDCIESEAFCLTDEKRKEKNTSYKTMSFSGKPCLTWKQGFESYGRRNPSAPGKDDKDKKCKSVYDTNGKIANTRKLKFAPYCFVQDHSAVVIEPCFASCEMAALKTLPNDYWHLVDVYAVGGRQTTWGGVECKPWMKVDPTLFQLHAHTNFCACPSQYRSYCERAGLFCFTTDSEIGWQGCYTTEASEDVDAKGCIDRQNMTDKYLGIRNYTYDGDRCLYWTEGSGVPSGRLKMAREHGVFGTNYCRNFFSEEEGPWCYVERRGEVVQQPCFRTCEERSKLDLADNPCFSSLSGALPNNMPVPRQRSNRDIPCLRWSLVRKGEADNNFCRVSSELDGLPGCYEATTQELRSCYIPCPGEEGDEFFFASEEPGCVPEKDRLAWYSGKRSITLNNNPCEYWEAISKASLPSMKDLLSLYRLGANKIEDAANYCRNLDYDPKGPWCMTVHMQKEYCFLRCSDANVHCLNVKERQVIDYQGDVHHMLSGRKCPIRNGRQTFCRNIDFEPVGPSCDVEGGGREPCFPLCSEIEAMSVEYRPFDVALKMAKTIDEKASKAIAHGLGKRMKLTGVRRAQRFAFWVFFSSLMILTLSCVGFPLLRYVPFVKAYLSGRLASMPKDRGYRKIVKVFHEHGRNPPSFQQFNIRRQQLGPEGDPLLALK
ncbi:hypothetical protein M514_06299 [Trichuris suis]|nr:hypothetical protein M514_06299 [Trichuris suis]